MENVFMLSTRLHSLCQHFISKPAPNCQWKPESRVTASAADAVSDDMRTTLGMRGVSPIVKPAPIQDHLVELLEHRFHARIGERAVQLAEAVRDQNEECRMRWIYFI